MPAIAPRPSRVATSRTEAVGDGMGGVLATFRWTRKRYDQAVEAGVFTTDDKVELLDGEVVSKMPQNRPHEVATGLVSDALRAAFGPTAHTRDEKSVALSDVSKPEPDVVVVRGARRDYLEKVPTPSDVLLLVEVADSSLVADRTKKAALYANAGILEYWIVNLQSHVLEVFRDPVDGVYGTKTTLGLEDAVAPVHAPDAPIPVADLLP